MLKNRRLIDFSDYTKRIKKYFENNFIFLKALLHNPRATGAIVPSSKRLAEEMVAHVYVPEGSLVVELGAGTGVVTRALLKKGIKPESIIAIEHSSELARELVLSLPQVKIIHGDAANLSELLGKDKKRVTTIISSLPLRSLPKLTTNAILNQINTILSKGGRYIQYTYSFKYNPHYSLPHYHHIYSKRIWINAPPARVDVFVADYETRAVDV